MLSWCQFSFWARRVECSAGNVEDLNSLAVQDLSGGEVRAMTRAAKPSTLSHGHGVRQPSWTCTQGEVRRDHNPVLFDFDDANPVVARQSADRRTMPRASRLIRREVRLFPGTACPALAMQREEPFERIRHGNGLCGNPHLDVRFGAVCVPLVFRDLTEKLWAGLRRERYHQRLVAAALDMCAWLSSQNRRTELAVFEGVQQNEVDPLEQGVDKCLQQRRRGRARRLCPVSGFGDHHQATK